MTKAGPGLPPGLPSWRVMRPVHTHFSTDLMKDGKMVLSACYFESYETAAAHGESMVEELGDQYSFRTRKVTAPLPQFAWADSIIQRLSEMGPDSDATPKDLDDLVLEAGEYVKECGAF